MVPTISAVSDPIIIPIEVPYALRLAASHSPTAWSASGLPVGLSIDSAGLISGTPTLEGYEVASITATNEDGTSSALSLEYLVISGAYGTATTAAARKIDFELSTKKLWTPGSAWQPGEQPPVEGSRVPVMVLKAGDLFPLSIGIKNLGALIEPPPLTDIVITLKAAEDEDGVEIQVLSTDITVEGAGTLARHVIPVDLGSATIATWVTDGELVDQVNTYIDGLLEISLTAGSDLITSLPAPVRLFRQLRAA